MCSEVEVIYNKTTSDQHTNLPMSTRKLNNLFHPTYAGSRDMKSTPCNAHTAGTLHTVCKVRLHATFSGLQLLHMNINCLYSKIALNKRNIICKNDDFDRLYL